MASTGKVVIFQLGTNNWPTDDEPAPESGTFHSSFHAAFNKMDDTVSYSVYPSGLYDENPDDERVCVVKLEQAMPVFDGESLSPEGDIRWQAMGEEDFEAYMAKLEEVCYNYMGEIEAAEDCEISYAIGHHLLASPLVLERVNHRRFDEGKHPVPVLSFCHGHALKLLGKEVEGVEGYPERFYPMVKEKAMVSNGSCGILAVVLPADDLKVQFKQLFPQFPERRIFVGPGVKVEDAASIGKQCSHIREKMMEIMGELDAKEKRVRERAYFRYLDTGCCDAMENYREALKQEEQEGEQQRQGLAQAARGGA